MSYKHDSTDNDLSIGHNYVKLTLNSLNQIKLNDKTYAVLHIKDSKNIIILNNNSSPDELLKNYTSPNAIEFKPNKNYEISDIEVIEKGKKPNTGFSMKYIIIFIIILLIALFVGYKYIKRKFIAPVERYIPTF